MKQVIGWIGHKVKRLQWLLGNPLLNPHLQGESLRIARRRWERREP